jgi:hypothetical protein
VHYVAPGGANPPENRVQHASRLRGRFDRGDIELFKEICKWSDDTQRSRTKHGLMADGGRGGLIAHCRVLTVVAGGQSTDPSRYPLASSVAKNVVVYDGNTIRKSLATSSSTRDEFMAEFHDCLLQGPGVMAIKGCMPDHSVLDRANAAFRTIIDREKSESGVKGDHFAPAGNNERVWNSFQKHAVEDPEGFVDYYANEVL